MNIYPFIPTFPHLELISSPDSFFSSIKSQYLNHKEAGFFDEFNEKCVLVHKINSGKQQFIGLVASNDIDDLKNNKIFKHENTLESKEQTMMNFFMNSRAMVKPILLAYKPNKEIDNLLNQLIAHKKADKDIQFENELRHRFWIINDEKIIDQLTLLFSTKVKKSYIADGHHRCSTVLKMAQNKVLNKDGKELSSILSAYYSFDNLQVFDYNRILDIQGEMSPIKFIIRMSKYCHIKPLNKPGKPSKKHKIHMLISGEWFEAKWKKSILKKYKNLKLVLDASLLNKYIFNKIVGIADVRTDPRISYSSGILPLEQVCKPLRKERYKIGFFLHSLDLEDVILAADENLCLPPKTTGFEPRLKSGKVGSEF
jgi:uncharacterized protein (DUF1015 family)